MAMKGAADSFGILQCVKDAQELLRNHTDSSAADADASIPPWVIAKCRGVAFMFTYKIGIFASASGGSGIVMAKKPGTEEWGMPVGVGLGGLGGGLDFGANKTFQIVVLNTEDAVRTYVSDNVKLGVGIAMAAGPVGRQAEGSANMRIGNEQGQSVVPAFTYGYTKGLFAGIGLQGCWITSKDQENAAFYGLPAPVPASELLLGSALAGRQPTPEVAQLQAQLQAVAGM